MFATQDIYEYHYSQSSEDLDVTSYCKSTNSTGIENLE